MSSKFSRQTLEFKRQRFLWLDQVLVDPELPASAFKVAYRISQGFNDVRYDGKAWESCKKIGDAIGMSEKTVITMVRRLHASGHLRVEWGRQGRGHPHNYWMILKPASAQVFDEIKPASTPRKPAPTQENHTTNHDRETPNGVSPGEGEAAGAAASAARTSLVVGPPRRQEEKKEKESECCSQDLLALRGQWVRKHVRDRTVRELKAQEEAWAAAMASGVAPEAIFNGVPKWKARYTQDMLPALSDWLATRSWEEEPPPKPKANSQGNGHRHGRRRSKGKSAQEAIHERITQRIFEGRMQ